MRLWHKDLISVLPRKQLLAQWRECCCIAKNISKDGTPNHLLVNKILNYSSTHFLAYTNLILEEMHKRSYKVNQKSYESFCKNLEASFPFFKNNNIITGQNWLYKDWHNDRYYEQCFRNLEEKYDCGMFTKDEWSKIENQRNERNNYGKDR